MHKYIEHITEETSPSSAFKRMRAWASSRAGARPWAIRRCSLPRSPGLKLMGFFSAWERLLMFVAMQPHRWVEAVTLPEKGMDANRTCQNTRPLGE